MIYTMFVCLLLQNIERKSQITFTMIMHNNDDDDDDDDAGYSEIVCCFNMFL